MSAPPGPTAPRVLRNLRRLEWYLRIQSYCVVGSTLFGGLNLLLIHREPLSDARLAAFVIMSALATALCVLSCHWAFSAMQHGHPIGQALRGRLGLSLLAVLAVDAVGFAVLPAVRGQVGYYAVLSVVSALTPLLTWWQMLVATGALTVFVGIGYGMLGPLGMPTSASAVAGFTLALVVLGVVYVGSMWLTTWMLRVVWELDAYRETAARLAVADERMRFGRDLHDTLGRELSIISVKSSLAAELIRHDRQQAAADEVEQVHTIAERAARDARAVARGSHRPVLTEELSGARAVLRAAGIACTVEAGPAEDLPEPIATAFGWVVREAVTNVLRHSRASWCTLRLETTGFDGVTVLTITNDGVGTATADNGSGLSGLDQRVAALGGSVRGCRVDDRFVTVARAPRTASTVPQAQGVPTGLPVPGPLLDGGAR